MRVLISQVKNTRTVIMSALTLCVFICGCSNRSQDLNQQALEDLKQGNLSEAVLKLETASRLAPDRPEILYNLAEAYRRQGRLSDALLVTEQAAMTAPKNPKIAAARSRLLLLNNRAGDALSAIENLPPKIRGNSEVSFYHALALIETGQAGEAQPILEKLLVTKPRSAPLHAAFGLACMKQGQLSLAQENLEKAVQIDKKLVMARLYLATYYLEHSRRIDEAKKHLYAAKQIEPDNPEIHLLLGQAHLADHLLREASLSFKKTLELQPRNSRAYLGLAEGALQQGDLDTALSFARQAQKTAPELPEVFNFLGRLYSQRSQTSLAIQAYNKSLELNPSQESIKKTLNQITGKESTP